jgi:hypothetical protein
VVEQVLGVPGATLFIRCIVPLYPRFPAAGAVNQLTIVFPEMTCVEASVKVIVAVIVGVPAFNTDSYKTYSFVYFAGVTNVAVPVEGITEPLKVLLATVIALFAVVLCIVYVNPEVDALL